MNHGNSPDIPAGHCLINDGFDLFFSHPRVVLEKQTRHRVGQLYPGDEIVFVGAASHHRGNAFDACEFIIDYLKTRATFWKKETTETGDRWLATRDSDIQTADTWNR